MDNADLFYFVLESPEICPCVLMHALHSLIFLKFIFESKMVGYLKDNRAHAKGSWALIPIHLYIGAQNPLIFSHWAVSANAILG